MELVGQLKQRILIIDFFKHRHKVENKALIALPGVIVYHKCTASIVFTSLE